MVGALFTDVVGALSHAVGLVIDVAADDGVFVVLVVDLLNGVAAFVVAVFVVIIILAVPFASLLISAYAPMLSTIRLNGIWVQSSGG